MRTRCQYERLQTGSKPSSGTVHLQGVYTGLELANLSHQHPACARMTDKMIPIRFTAQYSHNPFIESDLSRSNQLLLHVNQIRNQMLDVIQT